MDLAASIAPFLGLPTGAYVGLPAFDPAAGTRRDQLELNKASEAWDTSQSNPCNLPDSLDAVKNSQSMAN
ncbi:unnamed protein product [Sphagnum balticum]